jgi:predicted homoserine dehydrogenase-like protein
MISILCAGLLGLPTGSTDYRPRFDAVARTSRGMKAGERVQLEDLCGLVRPARPPKADVPLPVRLAVGRPLAVDLAPGALLTSDAVVPPSESPLWSLRAEQDLYFLKESRSVS